MSFIRLNINMEICMEIEIERNVKNPGSGIFFIERFTIAGIFVFGKISLTGEFRLINTGQAATLFPEALSSGKQLFLLLHCWQFRYYLLLRYWR